MDIIHISILPSFRLRLLDGAYVYMTWHSYCGPTFYKDKYLNRMIDEWYENPLMVRALDWFIARKYKA